MCVGRTSTLAYYTTTSFGGSITLRDLPVLICMALSFFFLGTSLFGMCCAYCNKYIPYCIVLTDLFASRLMGGWGRAHTRFSVATALIGVLLYVVSMQDVEARRFTSYNSVYLVSMHPLTRLLTRPDCS